MSLIGIVGYPDLDFFDVNPINIRGCGKTLTMTYYLAQDKIAGKTIYTNYTTEFSIKKKSAEIVDMIFNDKNLNNVSVGFDEFQEVMSSLGEKHNKIKFYSKLINQSRKKMVDIYYCAPLYKDINNRIREKTNIGLHPTKHHLNGEACIKDHCYEKHYIKVGTFKPYYNTIKYLNPDIIGKLYNTFEIINEEDEEEN
jgi:hypothetical protein